MASLDTYMAEALAVSAAVAADAEMQAAWTKARDVILEALKAGKTIFVAGNGGSAADAQHFAAELTGRFKAERRSWPGIALTVDTSALTSIGNDYGFIRVFSRQLEGLGREGDVLVVISTSGNSANLVHACVVAEQKRISTIGLLGRDGGVLKEFVDVPVIVRANVTAHIQEVHLQMYHCFCVAVDALS